MTDKDSAEASRALLKFCRSLFETSNLIGTDFKDASILEVKRPFVQDEGGLHVQFTVSWHAFGKAGKDAHDALDVLLPKKPDFQRQRANYEGARKGIGPNGHRSALRAF